MRDVIDVTRGVIDVRPDLPKPRFPTVPASCGGGFTTLAGHLKREDKEHVDLLLDTHKQHLDMFRGLPTATPGVKLGVKQVIFFLQNWHFF